MSKLGEQLLDAIDEIVKPREIPRVIEPSPPQATTRCRLLRSVVIGGGYPGVDARPGDVLHLTKSEIAFARAGDWPWAEQIDPFPYVPGADPFVCIEE